MAGADAATGRLARLNASSARGAHPRLAPVHGYADHCRVFSEGELYQRFDHRPNFRLQKIPGAWKRGELPSCFEPTEFGSFFVSYASSGVPRGSRQLWVCY